MNLFGRATSICYAAGAVTATVVILFPSLLAILLAMLITYLAEQALMEFLSEHDDRSK